MRRLIQREATRSAALGIASIVIWTGLASAQTIYSEAQIKLAGQIGAVISLVDRCGKIPMPSAAIKRAMKAEGLKDSDLMQDTAFKARVTKQAQNMKAMESITAKAGETEANLRKEACKNLVEMYGANGYVRAGLASP